jgi:hypothetical protein
MIKLIYIILVVTLSGCSTVKQAQTEFKNDVRGFREEWVRVFHKKNQTQ